MMTEDEADTTTAEEPLDIESQKEESQPPLYKQRRDQTGLMQKYGRTCGAIWQFFLLY